MILNYFTNPRRSFFLGGGWRAELIYLHLVKKSLTFCLNRSFIAAFTCRCRESDSLTSCSPNHFFNIYFNSLLLDVPRSVPCLYFLQISNQSPSHLFHISNPFSFPASISSVIFGEDYTLYSSSLCGYLQTLRNSSL